MKGFIWFIIPYPSVSLREVKSGTQTRKEHEVMTNTESMSEQCLWDCFPEFVQPAFLYHPIQLYFLTSLHHAL